MRPSVAGFAGDGIAQTGIHHRAGVFIRPLLIVIGYIHFHVRWEEQSHFGFRLDSSPAVRTPFIRGPTADSEYFRAFEDVLIRIHDSGAYTPIAGTVGAFHFRRDRVQSTAGNRNRAIQKRIADRRESDIHILHRRERIHTRVRPLHAPFRIPIAVTQTTRSTQCILAQEWFIHVIRHVAQIVLRT